MQAEMLEEACERELVRLLDLRSHYAGETGLLVAWLDHEIAEIESAATGSGNCGPRLEASGSNRREIAGASPAMTFRV